MKILKWFLIVFAVLVILALIYLYYMGVFSTLKTSKMKTGPYLLVYEEYTGPYGSTGKVFDKVYRAVKAKGIETQKGIGIYLDEPGKVPQDKLRSQLGVVIEEKDIAKFNRVKRKFKSKTIKQANSIVAEFPIRNSFSYMIGPMKGYPALMKYAKDNNYKMARPYELYDMPGGKILYIMEVVIK